MDGGMVDGVIDGWIDGGMADEGGMGGPLCLSPWC